MKPAAGQGTAGPVLVDRASSFGLGFGPQRRRRGTLTLTETALRFRSADDRDIHDIPLVDIVGLSISTSHLGAPFGQSVLRVQYQKNLVFGVAVASPDTWINAINALTPTRTLGSTTSRRARARASDVSGFRVVVGLLLLMVLLMSVAIPLFLSWMQARDGSPVEQVEPEALFGP